MSKSCFQRKEMPIAKRRKVLTFRSWLKLAMEDVFLGHLSLFVSVIPLSKFWCHGRMGWTRWQRGKNSKSEASQRLTGVFPEVWTRSFIYYMTVTKKWPCVLNNKLRSSLKLNLLHLHSVTQYMKSIRQPVMEKFTFLFFIEFGGGP